MTYTLHHGDCLDVLKTLPDCSVNSIVSDPPYGLSFMGKRWDYDVPAIEVWAECLRVLKPGGHLLAFAGTRTQHRMAVRIEDAGFEIRDMIAWVYGSGFAKSADVSKAIDKGQGENHARQLQFTAWMRSTGITAEQINKATQSCMASHYLTDKSQPAIATADMFDKLRPYLPEVPEYIERLVCERTGLEWTAYKQREVVGKGQSGTTAIWSDGGMGEFNITAPATDAARQWQGWGTALKPALEPITVARKPLIGTVAANVLAHGTGGINVDGCRVKSDELKGKIYNNKGDALTWGGTYGKGTVEGNAIGRWPANLIHDGSEEVLAGFPVTGASKVQPRNQAARPSQTSKGAESARLGVMGHDDNGGSAARFFYCAKASKRDRDEGLEGFEKRNNMRVNGPRESEEAKHITKLANHHPTVKPTDLMRYLCRLVTPPGGIVLDPFTGSGSTGKAAILEGFQFIGIEREAEYIEIARARIEHAHEQKSGMLL